MKDYTVENNRHFFDDYSYTKLIYHVVPIIKLNETLKDGLKVNKRSSHKYIEFNDYFDKLKPDNIPEWVSRKEAIYGSLNFKKNNNWHSHSAVLSFEVDEEKCWIGNESLANILYEPFILAKTGIFTSAIKLIETRGEDFVLKYWKNSINFIDNLRIRMDRMNNYDSEVLIMHDIPPQDINIVMIVSDHKSMSIEECNSVFNKLLTSDR